MINRKTMVALFQQNSSRKDPCNKYTVNYIGTKPYALNIWHQLKNSMESFLLADR